MAVASIAVLTLFAAAHAVSPGSVRAQSAPPPLDLTNVPPALGTVPVPQPRDLARFVKSKSAAITLGKALFWDMQLGSDGVTACATCHYHAGADDRFTNQVNPALLAGDTTFAGHAPNSTLVPESFPFHRLADPDDRDSAVLADTNDVASSQGVRLRSFVGVTPGQPADRGAVVFDPTFSVAGTNVRRVEPRNTPTVINAVFNHRNFWDGRASDTFNGVSPFGASDGAARVFELRDGQLRATTARLDSASLASQAVGPPLSSFEMSFDGRTWPAIGRRLLKGRALAQQVVAADDSVLGSLALNTRKTPGAKGLKVDYATLVSQAFRPEWLSAKQLVRFDASGPVIVTAPKRGPAGPNDFTQAEANFSLFAGLAIQLYEATLVSDDAPFDRFRKGQLDALTERQKQGLSVFFGPGRCFRCHAGPEFTAASMANAGQSPIGRMLMGDRLIAIYDKGYYNLGVRPTAEDLGVGGTDPFQNPLSLARRAVAGDPVGNTLFPPALPVERVAANGGVKAPGLRNAELTGPYMRNGGLATLRQVVDFYNRGGDFHGANLADADNGIGPLGLSEDDRVALVDFSMALTDDRVRHERAPFDHPQLFIPNGAVGDTSTVQGAGGEATDNMIEIQLTGKVGGPPLKPFLDLDPQRR